MTDQTEPVSGNDDPVTMTREQDLAEMLDLLASERNAELDPELVPHVEEHETFGSMLRHPLVYSVPLVMPGLLNRQLRMKKQRLTEALAQEDWNTAVFIHERAHRVTALIDIATGRDETGTPIPLIDVPQHWALATSVWVDSENIDQMIDSWRALFGETPASDGLWLGDLDEQVEFQNLPDPITAWRGEIDDGGWSYSTDKQIAEWFARRFGANNAVVEEQIPKSRVFGYLTRRGESELLVQRDGDG